MLRHSLATFHPAHGLTLHPSPKEELLHLLSTGFFDNAVSLIVACADSTDSFRTHFSGSYLQTLGLSSYLQTRIYEHNQYESERTQP